MYGPLGCLVLACNGSLIKNIQALDILCYARLMKYTAFSLFIALMTSHAAAQTPADAMSRKSQNWQNLQNSRPSVARPNFTVNEFDSSLKAMPLPAPPIADGGGSYRPPPPGTGGVTPRPWNDNGPYWPGGNGPDSLIDEHGQPRPPKTGGVMPPPWQPPIADDTGMRPPPVLVDDSGMKPRPPIADDTGMRPPPVLVDDSGMKPRPPIADDSGMYPPQKSDPLPPPVTVVPKKSDPLPPPVIDERYVSIEHSDPLPPPVVVPKKSNPLPPPVN